MTVLQKPIRRELAFPIDRRSWIVTVESWGVTLRQKHTRGESGTFSISWASVYERAAEIKAAKMRAEKLSRKRGVA